MISRVNIVVRGVVQGVGFRPFIYRLATEHNLTGWVLNSSEGVVIDVEGADLDSFVGDITAKAPPMARIQKIEVTPLPLVGYRTFAIEPSQEVVGAYALISPDICICPDCRTELFEPENRRYRYPFINCTNCGPRFSITRDIPYDRPKTTMAKFTMCPECQSEYDDPLDRRFHAQPNACPICGPRVWLEGKTADGAFRPLEGEAISLAKRYLASGGILAVKGLGGFHLACEASNDEAVAELRRRKGRVGKPFAVMVPDVETASRYSFVDEGERRLLESWSRPIVLLRRKPDAEISSLVAPDNCYVGVMLPYTPLHYLLLTSEKGGQTASPRALVMTSGNYSEEPISIANDEAREKLGRLCDAFLMHDRDIHVRCDDSVGRIVESKEATIRRSRGFAPFPVRLSFNLRPILACGGELKNTFCLTKDNYAFVSHHIGDLENLETLASFREGIDHFVKLFRIEPEIVAHDLHPEYLSTKYAQGLLSGAHPRPALGGERSVSQAKPRELVLAPVQHHHAHMASCMAENGLDESVIGVTFDGTGYGPDGAIWGGEILVGGFSGFERWAHLKYVRLPGGEAAIKRPYRMALSHLFDAFGDGRAFRPLAERISAAESEIVRRQVDKGLNSPLTSSCGRLFDAISALIGLRDVVTFEGQAAIELEMIADETVEDWYSLPLLGGALPLVLDTVPLIRDVVGDIQRGQAKEV
ncbi:MAG: carbamoyltransferase HypF, partial [Chloroflexi bacterium]|nr:carbamoyltransferase HypF [Chloroflexota bacterium]